MSVKFKPVARINPKDPTQPKKYYPQVVQGDDTSFIDLALLISKLSNTNYGVVNGTLSTFWEVMELELKQGRQVKLGDVGVVYLTGNGDGTETPEELSASDVKKANVRFRPSKLLRKSIQNLDFEKVSNNNATEEQTSEEAAA